MNIVNIGSDKSLVGGKALGDAISRHQEYGRFVDHLDIIVYSKKKENFKEFRIADNVIGHPTNSLSKIFFLGDCLKIFQQINQNHKTDIVVCQDPFIFALAGAWLKRKYGIKLQINFHGDFWDNEEWLKENVKNRLFLLVSYFTVRQADGIRVVSRGIKDKLVKRGIGENKIRVIPTPVDLNKFSSPNQEEVNKIREKYQGKKILLFVGRLEKVKDFPALLEALKIVKEKYDNFVLLVIGSGSLEEKWKGIVKDNDLSSQIIFKGQLAHDKLVDFYYASSFLVNSSTNESFGKIFVEAAACGKPTVATATTGAREIIINQETGLLSPVGGINLLAQNILRLLQDDSFIKSLGNRAKALVIERFDGRKNAEKIINFWKEAVSFVK